jgi:ribosomal protein S13
MLREVSAMIGNIKDDVPVDELDDDIEDDDLDEDDDVEDMDDDNVGDISVEINVEELVAKLEATDNDDIARRREIRRRLEELEDMRRANKDLDSTFNFDLDDDL